MDVHHQGFREIKRARISIVQRAKATAAAASRGGNKLRRKREKREESERENSGVGGKYAACARASERESASEAIVRYLSSEFRYTEYI